MRASSASVAVRTLATLASGTEGKTDSAKAREFCKALREEPPTRHVDETESACDRRAMRAPRSCASLLERCAVLARVQVLVDTSTNRAPQRVRLHVRPRSAWELQ